MPIIYIEGIKTTLLTLFGCILGFIGGKVGSALNNTRFMTSPSEFTNFQIFNFQLFQFSHLLEVVVIRRKKLPGQIPTIMKLFLGMPYSVESLFPLYSIIIFYLTFMSIAILVIFSNNENNS